MKSNFCTSKPNWCQLNSINSLVTLFVHHWLKYVSFNSLAWLLSLVAHNNHIILLAPTQSIGLHRTRVASCNWIHLSLLIYPLVKLHCNGQIFWTFLQFHLCFCATWYFHQNGSIILQWNAAKVNCQPHCT